MLIELSDFGRGVLHSLTVVERPLFEQPSTEVMQPERLRLLALWLHISVVFQRELQLKSKQTI